MLSCASLAGEEVLGIGGQELGRLQHVMLDVRAGRIAYGVLAAGGVFGLGARLYAVPWSAFEFDEPRLCLRVPVDRERLERAPPFDEEHWPASGSPDWVRQVHEHFAPPPRGA